ncbi:MAG: hypothetical protein HQ567_29545 [Candidatus Nealsonbacteria bacterium]|nr:hypothetical protein [Candidatus Nealsonbacteria bacterium]
MPAKRHRAGGIVIHQGTVPLMHRVKKARQYYAIPGELVRLAKLPLLPEEIKQAILEYSPDGGL